MAEGSYRMESEGFTVEDIDEGSDEVGEEEMVEGNDYEEYGAFGGYGTLTSFDIRVLRAFGSVGPGLRILSVRPLLGHLFAQGPHASDLHTPAWGQGWVFLPCETEEEWSRGWMKERG